MYILDNLWFLFIDVAGAIAAVGAASAMPATPMPHIQKRREKYGRKQFRFGLASRRAGNLIGAVKANR